MSVPSGSIYLVKNALVDRSYSHTIDFKNSSEQLAYWSSLVKYSLSDYSYIRRSSQLIKVEKTLDELQDVNYLFYKAKEDSKLYYCFVTNKEYVNDTVTAVYFEVDVLQTRMFEYQVKQSYVLQEHCDRWTAEHKPIYSRTDEGLEYGSEYTIEAGYKIKPEEDLDLFRWYAVMCKPNGSIVNEGYTTSLADTIGTVNPYVIFLIPEPIYENSHVSPQIRITDTEGNIKTFGTTTVKNLLYTMSNSNLGEYVQQIVRLPYLPIDHKISKDTVISGFYLIDFSNSGLKLQSTSLKAGTDSTAHLLRIPKLQGTLHKQLAEMGVFEGIEDALPTAKQWEEIKANPYTTERDKRFESKLLTHPYRYNLLTDWKNVPIVIKNEFIGGDKIKLDYIQSISFNSPARYWVEGYKKDPEGRGSALTQMIPEEAPIITDAYYSYMLQNKNQIQADKTNAMISGITSTVQGAVGGGILGNMGGGLDLAGGLMGGISAGANAVVNYQNLVRSQNAKQKDLKNLPDTIVNPNDANFSYFDGNEYISFYRYKICCEFEQLLADTFAMSGYTVKQVKVPNLKTRVRYNYVKTVGANIVGSFDQNDLTLIRQIFDNGVTFWHYNTVNFKPLDYSLENIETKLL